MSLPSTTLAVGIAHPPAGSDGLTCVGPAESTVGRPLVLVGAFRLHRRSVTMLGTQPHRALTIIAAPGAHGRGIRTALPFATVALFDEDLQRHQDDVLGAFQIDVSAACGLNQPLAWYLGVQLGSVVAPTIRCMIR